ncbi:MAG TPA: sigma 54-interacting transcriptional regulator, partial [Candidatus Copromorpha excrementavium]|nr:sigma 54-interacting transcriptional regulator [Candidatus Copromorpha excrementavium]
MDKQKLYDIIFDNPYLGICVTDGECNVIDVNEVHSRITGLSEEVFRGNNMRDLVNKKVLSVSSSVEVAKKGEEVTLHQMVSNGRHYDVKAFPIKDKENNDCIEYIVSFLLDVSDIIKTKEIANRLKQNVLEMEEKYKKLLTSVGEKDSESIIYKSKKMQDLVDRAKKCSENDVPVLITGPSGSGKEMIASLIHRESGRKNEKFIKINCAAIPENLLESELFGYEKGAFTGALKDGKRGILEECSGGTILLDEIGEMSLSVQAKLLRVLQENKIRRIGSSEEKEVDVRILAATNVNLKEKIKQKSFRADLYYRLNVIELKVPGLKERIEDIPLLIYYFMQIFNEKYKKDKKLDRESVKYLCGIEYPGNVRELKNTVERLIIQSDDKNISLEEVLDIMDVDETHYYKGSRVDLDLYKGKGLKEIMADYEKNVLKEFFMEYRNSSQVAKRLKVDRTTISRKRKEY